MSDVDAEGLPSVTEAKALQRAKAGADRSKEHSTDKSKHLSETATVPILLKVERPVDHSSTQPLNLSNPSRPSVEKQEPGSVPKEQKIKSQAGRIKRLYSAAVVKARSVFEKNPRVKANPRNESAKKQAEPRQATLPETAAQLELKQKLVHARQLDRKALITQPTPSKERIVERDPFPGPRQKLSREEMSGLMERQRRQREIGGHHADENATFSTQLGLIKQGIRASRYFAR